LNTQLDLTRLPAHVAIIMDGNGRWAKEKGMIRLQGHNAGMNSLREIVRHSSDIGIKYLTVYAFSTENWTRPIEEVSGIFKLLVKYVASELDELHKNNVKINILGDISALPGDSQDAARLATEKTCENTGLVFNIAINYGGRAEIIKAINDIIKEKPETPVDIATFEKHLYTVGMPDPDVIIRTGGECRISNFLTWQCAYSEFVITPVYWPDFTPEEYEKCLVEFQKRDRRYGGLT